MLYMERKFKFLIRHLIITWSKWSTTTYSKEQDTFLLTFGPVMSKLLTSLKSRRKVKYSGSSVRIIIAIN